MPDHFFDWNSAESLATISDSDYYDVLMAASHHASDPFPAFGATSSGYILIENLKKKSDPQLCLFHLFIISDKQLNVSRLENWV